MKILKTFYAVIIIAGSVVSFWVVSTRHTEQSDFLLRNVEALANEEGMNRYVCVGEGNGICPVTGKKVRVVYTLSR